LNIWSIKKQEIENIEKYKQYDVQDLILISAGKNYRTGKCNSKS